MYIHTYLQKLRFKTVALFRVRHNHRQVVCFAFNCVAQLEPRVLERWAFPAVDTFVALHQTPRVLPCRFCRSGAGPPARRVRETLLSSTDGLSPTEDRSEVVFKLASALAITSAVT